MIHAFLLIVLVNGEAVSKDMYFRNVNECVYFAQVLRRQSRKKITSYCIPVQIDPEKVRAY